MYIPYHTLINGNEKPDALAKDRTCMLMPYPRLILGLPPKAAKIKLRRK